MENLATPFYAENPQSPFFWLFLIFLSLSTYLLLTLPISSPISFSFILALFSGFYSLVLLPSFNIVQYTVKREYTSVATTLENKGHLFCPSAFKFKCTIRQLSSEALFYSISVYPSGI